MTNRRRPSADPHPAMRDAVAVSRFWRLVQVKDSSHCWPWTGDTDRDGYGVFFYRGKRYGAHELSLSFTTGEVRASDLETCHSCDNPPCVNPSHLRFDTRKSNVADMRQRGRSRNGSTKLTAELVRTIRHRRALGARQKDLADQYGVTDGQISMIVRGLRWADAGGPIQAERESA